MYRSSSPVGRSCRLSMRQEMSDVGDFRSLPGLLAMQARCVNEGVVETVSQRHGCTVKWFAVCHRHERSPSPDDDTICGCALRFVAGARKHGGKWLALYFASERSVAPSPPPSPQMGRGSAPSAGRERAEFAAPAAYNWCGAAHRSSTQRIRRRSVDVMEAPAMEGPSCSNGSRIARSARAAAWTCSWRSSSRRSAISTA